MNTSRRSKHKVMFRLTSLFFSNQYMFVGNDKILDFFYADFSESWECMNIDILAAFNY